ncbi:hypothetical protein GOP47_0009391 [Adiantum capillus-veneris]|uniref:Uncharacterized protein n=1 Tax=Adiantum capillus-veneris TaxID=13818 RepID=A0A9D4UW46_ADICA|nr:hypothetical protein GOP47_0009391 [Adiantum capillus-veneris]
MTERKGERVRIYVQGIILGYKRGKSNQYHSTSLLKIEGVNTIEEVNWYLGKRIAKHLPPSSLGGRVRVFMYPSQI